MPSDSPVLTTASPKNFDYVKSLGAAYAFDYKSKDVVRDIAAVLRDKDVVGALAIGAGSAPRCLDILSHCRGRRFIANCSADVPFDTLGVGRRISPLAILKVLLLMARANVDTRRKSRRHGITAKFFDASSVVDNEIGPAIYRDYLGSALAGRRFRPPPPPQVVGHGLESIQTAFDFQRAGVSAAKVVVTLD
jgi:hypothetical protein